MTNEEEVELVEGLRFNEGDEWLKLLYRCKCKKVQAEPNHSTWKVEASPVCSHLLLVLLAVHRPRRDRVQLGQAGGRRFIAPLDGIGGGSCRDGGTRRRREKGQRRDITAVHSIPRPVFFYGPEGQVIAGASCGPHGGCHTDASRFHQARSLSAATSANSAATVRQCTLSIPHFSESNSSTW